MSEDIIYSIGQMAKICNVSVQNLRYYDNINLIKPAIVKDNGYRFYQEGQILPVNIIKAPYQFGIYNQVWAAILIIRYLKMIGEVCF